MCGIADIFAYHYAAAPVDLVPEPKGHRLMYA